MFNISWFEPYPLLRRGDRHFQKGQKEGGGEGLSINKEDIKKWGLSKERNDKIYHQILHSKRVLRKVLLCNLF